VIDLLLSSVLSKMFVVYGVTIRKMTDGRTLRGGWVARGKNRCTVYRVAVICYSNQNMTLCNLT
jgi:hypothetical protein